MRKCLLCATALLALTLASFGLGAGLPTTGGDAGTASPAVAAPAGRCSKAAAVQVVERLHMGDPGIRNVSNRVAQVLCGAFLGPGSQTMVVTVANGTCLPNSGWAVFRLTGGAWQLVPNGYHGGFVAALAAVGSDIRESVPVWRKGEEMCFPTGGTKARIWHWNGARFVAGPWKLTPAKLQLHNFLSPDRKVWCQIFSYPSEDRAWCVTIDPQHSASLKRNGDVTICTGFCTQDWDRGAPVLRYGQQTEFNGFRCTSETKGITCTVIRSGKGFLINRAGVSRVGP